MRRRHELELMVDPKQVKVYAEADFEEAHSFFMRQLQESFSQDICGYVLDLGCGPGNIAVRFARTFPRCIVHGVDGSEAMLDYARKVADSSGIHERIQFFKGILPQLSLPIDKYDAIISNSVLHHIRRPAVFWQAIQRYSQRGTRIFVMDLQRPRTTGEARALVEKYSASDSPILRRDFYNSFLAAFETGEIEAQLKNAGVNSLSVKVVSDRHLCVTGTMSV
jgi:ubiquinone/menaquinone biosynthesis C-methylase UbiE